MDKINNNIPAERAVMSGSMLFADFMKCWLNEVKDLIKPSTWEGYDKVTNNKIIPYFKPKHQKLNELKGFDFTKYFAYLKEHGKRNGANGLGKKSIENIRGVLSSAFGFAVENDLIDYNYIIHSHLPKFSQTEPKRKTVIYTSEQILRLLDYAEQTNPDVYVFLMLVVSTGARKGEIMGLSWDNVDFERGTIHICKNRTGNRKELLSVPTTPKSDNSDRILSLPQKTMQVLANEKERQNKYRRIFKDSYIDYEYDYVLRKADGSYYNPNSYNRTINKMMTKLNLPHCTVHDLRHTVATLLFESNVDLKDISKQLGHGQISTTERIYISRYNVVDNTNIIENFLGF